MTPAQRTAVQAAIANAATLEEVQRLEAALSSGQMPSSVQVRLRGLAASSLARCFSAGC